MSRDYTNTERYERRRSGGRDDWGSDSDDNYYPGEGEQVTNRSGWQGTAVTGYREAPEDERRRSADRDWDDDDHRDRNDRDDRGWSGERRSRQPVSWGRERDDERRYASRGADQDRDSFRSGDRDRRRGEFGPREDRTRWGQGDQDRDRRDAMRGESRGWQPADRDRDWRSSGNDPYRERFRDDRRQSETSFYRSSGDTDRNADWRRDTQEGRRADVPRSAYGAFTGRGPRGYQRSDERIREDVSELLWHHSDIDASDIDVSVQSAEVTLDGTVDDRWTKRLAEDTVWEARGVQDVHNRLRIRRDQLAGQQQTTQREHTYRRETAASAAADPESASPGAVELEGGRVGAGAQLRVDMAVVGSDGDEVGIIKELRGNDILVDRPMARDVYVPVSAITVSDGSTARLNVNSGDIDDQGWESPSLTGTDSDDDNRVELT